MVQGVAVFNSSISGITRWTWPFSFTKMWERCIVHYLQVLSPPPFLRLNGHNWPNLKHRKFTIKQKERGENLKGWHYLEKLQLLPLIVHPFHCRAAPELSSWFFPAEEVLLPAKEHKSGRKSISVVCSGKVHSTFSFSSVWSMKQNAVRYVFQPSNTLKRCKGHSQCNMSLSSPDNSDHQLWKSQLLSASSK